MRKRKSIEEEYRQIKDQREHVLLRPQTYIGANVTRTSTELVPGPDGKMIQNEVTSNPGFLKLFDEVFTNSVDEHRRDPQGLTRVEVLIDKDNSCITVRDDGGIPVALHKEYQKYVPEFIFGELLSGSNYDDTEERSGAGMNGLGAKLTNIFSKEFRVMTCDGSKQFEQVWTDNMSLTTGPVVKRGQKKNKGTNVTYFPELERFGMKVIDEDTVTMMYRRCIFASACNPGLTIIFMGKELKYDKWDKFASLYGDESLVVETGQWRVALCPADEHGQVSFVNSVHTMEGGTHLDHVVGMITNLIKEYVQKKYKMNIRPSDIRRHFRIMIDFTVSNPMFQSQAKEKLITPVKDMSGEFTMTPVQVKKLLSSGVMLKVEEWVKRESVAATDREKKALNRDISRHKVDKLIDAKGSRRELCSLGLFEGDSATSAFRKYRDPMTQGAYALKGKVMNVSEVTLKKISEDKDVMGLMSAIGLRFGERVNSGKLRYGRILFYVDADTDGDSIAALLLNLLFRNWPELFEMGIIYKVMTPVLVAESKKKGVDKVFFYTMGEYDKWSVGDRKSYDVKYKKGLASLVNDEYERIIREPVCVRMVSDEKTGENLDIWFKKDTTERKLLLTE